MKLTATFALLGLAQAIENTLDESAAARSVWVPADTIYRDVDDKECDSSWDCPDDFVCAGHLWAYNEQFESARGCWHKSVCKDEAFLMFDGRKIQFFCDADA